MNTFIFPSKPTFKVVQSEHIIEVYEYEKCPNMDIRKTKKEKPVGRAGDGKEERQEEYKASVNYKAREKCRRLINMNFNEKSDLFITLTYAENMTDIVQAHKDFKQFMQRIKRKYSPLEIRYLAVTEFQERGAVHFHMLCNFPISWNGKREREERERQLAHVWRHGFVDITEITEVDNLGAYLLKYMQKSFVDERHNGKKRYLLSKNLKQPELVVGAKQEILLETLEGIYPKFTSTYNSEFHGEVKYREYNLKWGISNVGSDDNKNHH